MKRRTTKVRTARGVGLGLAGALLAANLSGCGGAEQVSAEAKPAASSSVTIARAESTLSDVDMTIIQSTVERAGSIGLDGAQVEVVTGDNSATCADNGGLTVRSADRRPVYCEVNSTALLPAAWINTLAGQLSKKGSASDRVRALGYASATGLAMTMRRQAGVEAGKTDAQDDESLACYAGIITNKTNTPAAQTLANMLDSGLGHEVAAAFVNGANGGGCADYTGLETYGNPNIPRMPTTTLIHP
ncbi:MAG TPA: hypothetical protein VIR03_02280 [Candidatus Saccharimonadales bacterium]